MKKFKRLMALVAVGMLGIQLMGVGTALAGDGSDSDCDYGNGDLEITLGLKGTGSSGDVDLWVDTDGLLQCDSDDTDEEPSLASVSSITVEMDDDDSDGVLKIYLGDGKSSAGDTVEWPEFDTFDLDVTTEVVLDGGAVDDTAGNSMSIVVLAKSISFNGTTATSTAPAYDITGGGLRDSIDGSKFGGKLTVDGDGGNDVIKGGAGRDKLDGQGDNDTIYGNGGNDLITCGGEGDLGGTPKVYEFGWGGDGADTIVGCVVVAPGTGDDDITSDANGLVLSYADVAGGIEYTESATYDVSTGTGSSVTTGGAAGYDLFDDEPAAVYGGAGDDLIYAENASSLKGYGGNDVLKGGDCDCTGLNATYAGTTILGGSGNDLLVDVSYDVAINYFYGESGDDVLRGKGGGDVLAGGPGKDQAWGGSGADQCGAEVTNRCEFVKRASL